eukprot:CAMPEP_0182443928 /NCGR_PEP_ID=MMETSP1172-20130603/2536_1 /TAXON_ID=708627 /ORGANISM="Timspurckia oligopyrenoides, Strain CCMP3278" /LENGTH=64 /DNA_ID=CAMNT_0024639355 /DNA_START=294 /DNA_END=488 /DNA_ORIENTATION=-
MQSFSFSLAPSEGNQLDDRRAAAGDAKAAGERKAFRKKKHANNDIQNAKDPVHSNVLSSEQQLV